MNLQRCKRPHCGGQILDEDGRAACSLCARISHEPEPNVLEKLLSNATPLVDTSSGEDQAVWGPRVETDLSGLKARVVAKIRAEAGRAS